MTLASPWAYMLGSLVNSAVLDCTASSLPGTSPTEAMRQLLKQGRQSAAALAAAAGVRSALVLPLLKNDLRAGRVRSVKEDGRNWYEWADGYVVDLNRRLAEARALLTKHGYTVAGPDDEGAQQ
jgi:hypothetical protein